MNSAGVWEQRRIGILGDRRSSITAFRFAALTNVPFSCYVGELLAVEEDMVSDVEQALLDTLGGLSLPEATAVPLAVTAHPGDTQVVLTLATAFSAGNQVRLDGGSASPETHSVASASHDMVAPSQLAGPPARSPSRSWLPWCLRCGPSALASRPVSSVPADMEVSLVNDGPVTLIVEL